MSDGTVYKLNGRVVSREEFLEGAEGLKALEGTCGPLVGTVSGAWPLRSNALGVHPDQIPEAMERDKKHGVPTDYDPDTGEALIRGRGHRRDLMNSLGIHDNDGGYSDG